MENREDPRQIPEAAWERKGNRLVLPYKYNYLSRPWQMAVWYLLCFLFFCFFCFYCFVRTRITPSHGDHTIPGTREMGKHGGENALETTPLVITRAQPLALRRSGRTGDNQGRS